MVIQLKVMKGQQTWHMIINSNLFRITITKIKIIYSIFLRKCRCVVKLSSHLNVQYITTGESFFTTQDHRHIRKYHILLQINPSKYHKCQLFQQETLRVNLPTVYVTTLLFTIIIYIESFYRRIRWDYKDIQFLMSLLPS